MNKQRRKRMATAVEMIKKYTEELRDVLDEETEYRDNVPENLQGSERYEESEAICDALDSAIMDLESAIDSLDEISLA